MKHSFIILLISTLFLACSSPKELYEKGKYDAAFDKVLNDLKKKKNKKNKVLLNKSFSKLIDEQRGELVDIYNDPSYDDLKKNLKAFEEIEKRYDKGKSFLDDDNEAKYDKFIKEKAFNLDKVYDDGNTLMESYSGRNEKVYAQNAHLYYQLYDKFSDETDPQIQKLLEESLIKGTIVYAVSSDLLFELSQEWSVNRKFDDLEGWKGFTKVIYDNFENNADCKVVLEFRDLRSRDNQESLTRDFNKEVQDGYEEKQDTSGNIIKVPKYINVQGSVVTNRITRTYGWTIELSSRNVSGHCDLRDERFYAEVYDRIEQYEIYGDERAIPSQYFNDRDQRFRNEDDMIELLIEELYDQVENYIYP